MIRTAILLLVACISGCSSGRAPIKITEGSAAEFSNVRQVCIYGSDGDTNVRVEELIAQELSARIPDVIIQRPCGDNETHITIRYHSGLSGCTHCPPPYTGPRFATAFMQARNGCDIRAEAEWLWLNGGSAERVARRFAAIFAQFIDGTTTVPRSGG